MKKRGYEYVSCRLSPYPRIELLVGDQVVGLARRYERDVYPSERRRIAEAVLYRQALSAVGASTGEPWRSLRLRVRAVSREEGYPPIDETVRFESGDVTVYQHYVLIENAVLTVGA